MPERFWQYVEKGDGCWEWTGAEVGGYGYFRLGPRQVKAHRMAYELLVGPIPDDLVIDHLCRNTGCVNPAHMEPVSAGENVRRAGHAMTTCRRGHPFDEANTRFDKRGCRVCRACQRLNRNAWWHRQHPDAGYRAAEEGSSR